jgi:uncharacterized Zn-binding protein involved in type VI secretion
MKHRVTVEYMGHFRSNESHDYRITKMVGCAVVEVDNAKMTAGYEEARVGDIISEFQVEELARRVEITTVPKSK